MDPHSLATVSPESPPARELPGLPLFTPSPSRGDVQPASETPC